MKFNLHIKTFFYLMIIKMTSMSPGPNSIQIAQTINFSEVI